ncbi:MAG: hypothetical protein IPJ58_13305 [Ardenticatenia bacterium]|nr:hypothetical protein [Ardenticatenia bacterium]
MMQRDLWAVFDQITMGGEATPLPKLELRLVQAIRTLALSKTEVLDLPDSLELAVASGAFPTTFAQDHPTTTYLPPELVDPTGAWICLGRHDGPAAIAHVANFPFYGRSVFIPCLRAPAGRDASTKFLAALQENPRSADVPGGSEVALIRRALLIDKSGEIVRSPIVESIQLRHLYGTSGMRPFELTLDRERLFQHEQGGLAAVGFEQQDFALFRSPALDPFESRVFMDTAGTAQGAIPLLNCRQCHFVPGLETTEAESILSVTRKRFPVPAGQSASVRPSSIEEASSQTIAWKRTHPSWTRLQELWDQ